MQSKADVVVIVFIQRDVPNTLHDKVPIRTGKATFVDQDSLANEESE